MNRKNKQSSKESTNKINTRQKAWSYIEETCRKRNGSLSRIALKDGTAQYSYDQMFRLWQRYAAVFTAMGMTGANSCKAGVIGSSAPEAIFSVYGLNMVGTEVSLIPLQEYLNADKIIRFVKTEKLTDLVLTDDFLQDKVISELFEKKQSLGLNNIILLHVSMTNAAIPQAIANMINNKNALSRQILFCLYMDYLLLKFGDGPIAYGTADNKPAFIIHTSGTTNGIGKAITLSDQAINSACENMHQLKDYPFLHTDLVCAISIDLSNSYGFVDQVHLTFSFGGTAISVPGASLNPLFAKAASDYHATLLYANGFFLEVWMKMADKVTYDFSSLKGVVIGGSFASSDDKHRYYDFLRKHGAKDIPIVVGYGLSEFAGVVTLSSGDLDDESVGYPVNGMDVVLKDEESGKYYYPGENKCTGILYIHSDSIDTLKTNDGSLGKIEKIGRKYYLCTNDLMEMDKSGKLTYLGRCHQYYLNDNKIVFEAGRVETEIARCKGIISAGVVPVYDKHNHDNLPMLCVEMKKSEKCEEILKDALLKVFVRDKILDEKNIPYQIMICDSLPRNSNGKVNIYLINKSQVAGIKYRLELIKKNDEIKDIRLIETKEDVKDVMSEVYKELAKDMISGPIASLGENLMNSLGILDMKALMDKLNQILKDDKESLKQSRPADISETFEQFQQFINTLQYQKYSQLAFFSKQLNNFGKTAKKVFLDNSAKTNKE